jgi:hypothetical protein
MGDQQPPVSGYLESVANEPNFLRRYLMVWTGDLGTPARRLTILALFVVAAWTAWKLVPLM